MKDIDILEIIPKIRTFIRPQNSQGQTDKRPKMNSAIGSAKMMSDVMNLGVAIVTTGNTIISACGYYLVKLELAVGPALFSIARLEKAAAAAATVVVGLIGGHFYHIFFADYLSDDIPQIFSHGIAIAFTDDLTGILDSKLYFSLPVPLGIDLQSTLTDPFGVILIN